MDHVAIMKKSWSMIPKILSGTKKIESRWSKFKSAPWGKVKKGDRIFFKNSGESVEIQAKVWKVKEINNLNSKKVKELLEKYGGKDGIDIADIKFFQRWASKKGYCTLIYFHRVKKLKPFNINKSGFGSATAWITVDGINKIKV